MEGSLAVSLTGVPKAHIGGGHVSLNQATCVLLPILVQVHEIDGGFDGGIVQLGFPQAPRAAPPHHRAHQDGNQRQQKGHHGQEILSRKQLRRVSWVNHPHILDVPVGNAQLSPVDTLKESEKVATTSQRMTEHHSPSLSQCSCSQGVKHRLENRRNAQNSTIT